MEDVDKGLIAGFSCAKSSKCVTAICKIAHDHEPIPTRIRYPRANGIVLPWINAGSNDVVQPSDGRHRTDHRGAFDRVNRRDDGNLERNGVFLKTDSILVDGEPLTESSRTGLIPDSQSTSRRGVVSTEFNVLDLYGLFMTDTADMQSSGQLAERVQWSHKRG